MDKVKLPNGRKLFALDEYTVRHTFKEIYEEKSYLQNGIHIKSGDVIFDIGANIGLFSLFISENVTDLHIYAFEPIPQVFDVLTANLAHNSADIRAYNVGLADKEGTLEFTYYPRASVISSPVPVNYEKHLQMSLDESRKVWHFRIVPYRLRKWIIEKRLNRRLKPVKVTCSLKTLSQIIAENAIKTIDLIKLDAENCEEIVLKGINAEDWDKIRQMTIEVHTNTPNGENLVPRLEALLKEKEFSISLDDDTPRSIFGAHMLYATR
jgi:FkbM family methyltransferase